MSTTDTRVDDEFDDHLRRTLRAVAETVTLEDNAPLPVPAPPHRPGRPLLLAAVAAAVLLAGVAVALAGPLGGDSRVEVGTSIREPATGPPRLLVTAPGWEVSYANESSADAGEMTFRGPEGSLALNWERGVYEHRLDQLTTESGPDAAERVEDLTVAGHRAVVVRFEADYTALWADRDYAVRLFSNFSSTGESFRDLAATVEAVDSDTWLAALPESVVRPDDRAEVIEQMLAGVPLPAGYDRAALVADDGLVADRYMLGTRVILPVACGWVGQWVDATAAGDTAAAQEALDAMSTSFQWSVLQQMQTEGMLPQAIWEFTTAIAGDGTLDGAGGRVRVADVYAGPGGLNCTAG